MEMYIWDVGRCLVEMYVEPQFELVLMTAPMMTFGL